MRRERLKYNTCSALLNEAILLVCEFILPRQFLLFFGSEVNGLVASITQFLGFIALTEIGVGAVVISTLYKPLADNDDAEMSRILKSAANFFNNIGKLLLIYIAFLCVFYPIITKSSFTYSFTIPLILAIAISSVARYYFGVTYHLLLIADQRSYIPLLLNGLSMIVNTAVCVLLMHCGFNVQIVTLAAAIALLIKPVGMALFVRRHYRIDWKIELTGEPIQQKWNGLAHHFATFVLTYADVAILTTFSTLANVSIYNIYYLVVAGIRNLLLTMVTGVEALFGSLYAKHDPELQRYFSMYEWVMHTGVTLLFTSAGLLICPFISVYTRGVHDANYILPVFGGLLVAAYGGFCIRLPYNVMVKVAGHYRETQTSAIVEAGLNVILSILLVKGFGIYGVAVGTLVAMLYRTTYFAYYLSKAILFRPIWGYFKHLLLDAATILAIFFSTKWLLADVHTYMQWLILSAKVFAIATVEVLAINWLFYRAEFKTAVELLRDRKAKAKPQGTLNR